jgi:hypothetical protein
MLRQKPVKGGRLRLSPSVLREIEGAIARLAVRHNASKSFVVAVLLADQLDIPHETFVTKIVQVRGRRKKAG